MAPSEEEIIRLAIDLFRKNSITPRFLQGLIEDECMVQPVEDNVNDLEDRRRLLHEFIDAVRTSRWIDVKITTTTVALFLLAPTEILSLQVESAKVNAAVLGSSQARFNSTATQVLRLLLF